MVNKMVFKQQLQIFETLNRDPTEYKITPKTSSWSIINRMPKWCIMWEKYSLLVSYPSHFTEPRQKNLTNTACVHVKHTQHLPKVLMQGERGGNRNWINNYYADFSLDVFVTHYASPDPERWTQTPPKYPFLSSALSILLSKSDL